MLSDRDRVRLDGVALSLIAAIARVFEVMARDGRPMMVAPQGGVRTEAQQAALYAQGRTRPGRIVTHADGVRVRSNHQVWADGRGHAVDCCFADVPHYDERGPWTRFGELVEAEGLIWGGRWPGSRRDRPHVEERRP